jgi:glycosyltransferase involved in cell wall biosynthesis
MAVTPAEPASRRRILLLTPRWPYPVIGGDALRIWQLARAVSRHHDVTLLSLCQTEADLNSAPPDDGVFAAVHRVRLPRWRSWMQAVVGLMGSAPLQVAYYRSKEFQRRVDDLLPSHDLIWCHLVRTAPCARQAPVPRWLEMTDSIALTLDRASRVGPSVPWLRRFAFRTESRRMAQYEHEILKQFDLVSLISEIDRQQAFADLAPSRTRIVVAPNGVSPPSAELPLAGHRPPGVALIGRMDSLANRDALWYFAESVWPQVRLRVLQARLHVIGLVPEADARRLRTLDGVCVEGVVPRLSDVLQHCRVGVCPVRFGAGMQNKVLDCLAHGLATVTSPIGLEGLEARPGLDLELARTTSQWVDRVCGLLSNDAAASALGQAGQALVREHYSWSVTLRPALDALDTLWLEQPAAATSAL